MKKSKLAILGGSPVREKTFPPYNSLGEEEKNAVIRVMEGMTMSDFKANDVPRFYGGKFVRKFEEEFSKYFKIKNAVSFNSATTALQAAVVAAGIGPGDEVITSPFSMSATPTSVLLAGAVPVFADLDEKTSCLDTKKVEKLITKKTKAIIAVNLFGGSCDYDTLIPLAKKHNLIVIEDNAQGISGEYKGKLLGTIGDIGVYSLNVHKHIQSGEGGVLVTNNDDFAYRAQLVRNHGEVIVDERYEKTKNYQAIVGSNYRPSEIHMAVASEQLKKLDGLLKQRISLMTYLSNGLKKFPFLQVPYIFPDSKHVYYTYPFRFNKNVVSISSHTFIKAMEKEGFPLFIGYVKPLYLLRLYQERKMYPRSNFPFVYEKVNSNVSYEKGICPVAERLHSEELISLNLSFYYPKTKKDIDSFLEAVSKIEENMDELSEYEKRK